jgi:hypothetical protein
MIGVAAASASKQAILIAGVAGLVAGSMSMAVGEYISVSAQRDSEQAQNIIAIANGDQPAAVPTSGFLGDYSQLQPGKGGRPRSSIPTRTPGGANTPK